MKVVIFIPAELAQLHHRFSFIDHPFVLDPAMKSEVLRAENSVQMRNEMQVCGAPCFNRGAGMVMRKEQLIRCLRLPGGLGPGSACFHMYLAQRAMF
jgi:hypothetical protein